MTKQASLSTRSASLPREADPISRESSDQTVVEAELFRAQAMAHVRRRLQGDVILAIPVNLRVYGILIVTILAMAALFAVTASYSRKETVVGLLQPEGGLIRTSALQPGIIEEILVREGDAVSAGAPIAKLKLAYDVEAGASGDLLRRSLDEESIANGAYLTAALNNLAVRRAGLTRKNKILHENLTQTQFRAGLNADRLKLAQTDYDRNERLAEAEALSPARVEAALNTLLGSEITASTSKTSVLQLQQQIADTERELASIPVEAASLKAQTMATQAQLAQRATTTAAQTTYILTAPITGKVLAIPVERGQAMTPGNTIAVLAPRNSGLVADLYAPSRAAGFIKVGQEVRVKYQAFPHQKFGAARGKVVRVSSTVLGPAETANLGLDIKEPVFRVRVALPSESVLAYGESIPLQPGMLLDADIILDRRSLIEWLFDPLFAIGKM